MTQQYFKNPMQFLQAIKNGQNPEQLMMQVIQSRMGNTPMGQNLLNLAKNNDSKAIEQFARNFCAQRGLDFDKEFTAFKQSLGFKG